MKKSDFVNALRTLGVRVGRDLAPGDDGAYHYEFDDGLVCVAAYQDATGQGLLIAVLGRLPVAGAARLAVCERLLEWNGSAMDSGAGKLSLRLDSNHAHFIETLDEGDLDPDRFEALFAAFLDRAADLRARFLDLGAGDPSAAAPAAASVPPPAAIMG